MQMNITIIKIQILLGDYEKGFCCALLINGFLVSNLRNLGPVHSAQKCAEYIRRVVGNAPQSFQIITHYRIRHRNNMIVSAGAQASMVDLFCSELVCLGFIKGKCGFITTDFIAGDKVQWIKLK